MCVVWLASAACARGPAHGITLTVLGFNLESAQALRADAVDEFARTTGLAVDLIPTWGASAEQLGQKLRLLNQHASTPDVYLIDVVWTGTLGEHLMDLTPYADGEARNHIPALVANDTVKGRLVSLPFYVNIGLLYYRRDLLAKYGFSHPPATWDELESMSRKIQQGERAAGNREFWGYVWQGAAYEGLTCNALEWQASFGGGHIIEADGSISVKNPHTIQALGMAARWVGTISPGSVLSYTESDSLNAFRAGNAAFLRHWSGGVTAEDTKSFAIEGRLGATLLPAGPDGRAQTMGGFHLAVSRYSLHPQEAARLVLYLTSAPVELRRALDRGKLPTIPQLFRDPAVVKAFPYAAELETTSSAAWVARPSTIAGSHYAAVSRAYYETVHRILSGKIAAQAGLDALERKLVELTGGRPGAPAESP